MIRIYKYGEVSNSEIFARSTATVDIVADVRRRGDAALFEYTEKFDKVRLSDLAASKEEIEEGVAAVEPSFLEILEKAAANIRDYHKRQVRNSFVISEKPGVILGQKIRPIEKAGLYVPGGTAAYPSTVLMDSIPA